VGPTGLKEKDVNLAVAKELRDLLFWMGHDTVLTRKKDTTVSIQQRVAFLNHEKCSLAVSLHCNAATNREAGYVSTFVFPNAVKAARLAQHIQDELVKVTGWPDGGVRERKFAILRQTAMPAVLVEMGFISHPAQEKLLGQPDLQKQLAQAIAAGISQYLRSEAPAPPEPKSKNGEAENIAPWAAGAVKKATALGITDGKDLSRDLQRVLVWLDRLDLLETHENGSDGA